MKNISLRRKFRENLESAIQKNLIDAEIASINNLYFKELKYNGHFFLIDWWLEETCLKYFVSCEGVDTGDEVVEFREGIHIMYTQTINSQLEVSSHVDKIVDAIKTFDIRENVSQIFNRTKQFLADLNNIGGDPEINKQIFADAVNKNGIVL